MPAFLPVALSGQVSPRSIRRAAVDCATCAIVPDGGSCVCRAATGDINGHRFDAQCYGEPRSELVKDHNPACDLNLYDGGMACCGGFDPNSTEALPARYRLNIDQEIPPREDEVYLYFRWRFYYEGAAGISESPRETYHVECMAVW